MGTYFGYIWRYIERVLGSQIFHEIRSAAAQNYNDVHDACFHTNATAVFDGVHFKITDWRPDDAFFAEQREVVPDYDLLLISVPLFMVVSGTQGFEDSGDNTF